MRAALRQASQSRNRDCNTSIFNININKMKKKTLFSLLMASTLVVGCQQEELAGIEKAASVDLGNRPSLGAVSLTTGDPATRMALNESNNYSWKWEEGDKLGAAIVDMPNATTLNGADLSATGGEDYCSLSWTYAEYVKGKVQQTAPGRPWVTAKQAGVKIEDYYTMNTGSEISSNYPYIKVGGAWTTQANLVEGNYVFYAPYDKGHLTRQPLVITLPMEQDCSTESKALTDFYGGKTPVAIGNAFLAAPDNADEIIEPSVDMTNIFAYPLITIKNNFNGFLFDGAAAVSNKFWSSDVAKTYTMKLIKVEIYDATHPENLDYKRALDAPAYKTQVAAGWNKTRKADGTKIFTTGETSKILAATGDYNEATYAGYPQTQALARANAGYATEYLSGTSDIISNYQVKHITCDLGGKELANGEEYKFYVVMPAEEYENNLYAKVTVEINGKRYIILNRAADLAIDETVDSPTLGKANFADREIGTALADYNFRDVKHGDVGARLVRGQRYPAGEVLEDASAVKSFAGTMMTINLTGGKKQAAYAMRVAPVTTYKGITSNADFIEHITMNVQRGVSLTENNSVATVDRSEWNAEDIAFAPNNTVVINAELVKALFSRLYDNRGTATGDVLTLNTTSLPIASDVKVALKSGTTYTFTTFDGVSYDIDFGALINTTGTALKNGINTVSSAVTLARANNKVTGAVVFVSGATATLNAVDGITAINVAATGGLNVNKSTAALINNAGAITIGATGELTNANNALGGTIQNNFQKAVAGTVTGTVSAYIVGWPTNVIAATTQINALEVDLGTAGALTINNAEIAKLANLSDVALSVTANVTSIKSSSSVVLTNVASVSAASAIQWTTTAGAITVTCSDDPASFFTNITNGTGVTFVEE